MRRKVVGMVLATSCTLLLLIYLLLVTERGARLLFAAGERLTRGSFGVEKTRGSLLQGIELLGLRYGSGQVNVHIDEVHLRWLPARLMNGWLWIDSCDIQGMTIILDEKRENGTGKSGLTGAYPEISPPLYLGINRMVLRETVIQLPDEERYVLDSVVLGMQVRDELLTVDKGHLLGEGAQLDFSGNLTMSGPWPLTFAGEWAYETPEDGSISGVFSIFQTPVKPALKVTVQQPISVELTGELDLTNELLWQAAVHAEKIDLSAIQESLSGHLSIAFSTFGGIVQGQPAGEFVVQDISGNFSGHQTMLTGRGKINGMEIQALQLNAEVGGAALVLEGNISEELELVGNLQVNNFGSFFPGWQGEMSSRMHVQGSLTAPVLMGEITGKGVKDSNVNLGFVKGNYTVRIGDEEEFGFNLEFSAVALNNYHIDTITIDGGGNMATHSLALQLFTDETTLSMVADGAWQGDSWSGKMSRVMYETSRTDTLSLLEPVGLEIQRDRVDLDVFCLTHVSGKFCGGAQYNQGKWHGELRFEEFNPVVLHRHWQGEVNALVRGEGTFKGGHPQAQVELVSLSGTLFDRSLSGEGSVAVEKDLIACNNLWMKLGDASFKGDGIVAESNDFTVEMRIPDIGLFVPQTEGAFFLEGEITGGRNTPILDATFSLKDHRSNMLEARKIQGDFALDLNRSGSLHAHIRGQDIGHRKMRINELQATLEGRLDDHSYRIDADTEGGEISISGVGEYDSGWQGFLRGAKLSSSSLGDWELMEGSTLYASSDGGSIEDLCLESSPSRICFETRYTDSSWNLQAEVVHLSLDFLNNLGIFSSVVDGELHGTVEAEGGGGKVQVIDSRVSLPRMHIAEKGSGRVYGIKDAHLSAQYAENELSLLTGAMFAGDGHIDGRFQVRGLALQTGETPGGILSGQFDVDVPDLQLLSILTDARVETMGELKGEIGVTGSIAAPEIDGEIVLHDGGIELVDLGIVISDIAASVEGNRSAVEVDITSRAGDGSLECEAVIDLEDIDKPMLTVAIRGDGATLFDTTESRIIASPDLQFQWQKGEGVLTGMVDIPTALFTLKSNESGISPSTDVVILDGENPQGDTSQQFSSDVQIRLGENVRFEGYGLSSRVAGDVSLRAQPGKPFLAFGELRLVDGSYSLYSADLEIKRGLLFYNGGAVDNPGVSIQAERSIDDRTVGAEIIGTAERYSIQFYSEPHMSESEIVSYMMFGTPLNRSSRNDQRALVKAATSLAMEGVNRATDKFDAIIPVDEIYLDSDGSSEEMSLVLGKYITDDLFVGYDHNFFSNLGEFRVRYNLGYGFSVETTSSVESTSGDVLFIIER